MIKKGQTLEPAKKYRVRHRENGKIVSAIRIFKWPSVRFGNIPCGVFTSRVDKNVTAQYNKEEKTLTISGKRIPRQEVSIPIYDLIEFTAIQKAEAE